MKVYLAGKVTGEPNYAEKFARAADKLRAKGHEVYNPAAANFEGASLGFIMAHLLPHLCQWADAIALLPNWWRSPGARIEFLLARYLGKKIIWL